MYTCPCEVGCRNVKPLTTNCVSISVSLSERISLFNCKKVMSFVNIKASNLRFLSPQNLLVRRFAHMSVYIWTHLGQVPANCWSHRLRDTADAVVLKFGCRVLMLTFRLPEIAQTRLYLVQRCHCPGSQRKKQISGCVGDRLNIMNKWEDVQCYFCVNGSMRQWLEENTSI